MIQCERSVFLTSSEEVSRVCDLLPSNEGRQSLVSSLISAFGLDIQCTLVPIVKADLRALTSYHTPAFAQEILRKRSEGDETCTDLYSDEDSDRAISEKGLDSFGLTYDCPVFDLLPDYVKWVAGSSISAANALLGLLDSVCKVAINWYGGRHHCFKDRAAGFCYVNDIVLAVQRLRLKYKRVFYLDIDLHHGDGVEKAFEFSSYVTTCSVHRYDVGFFPGTGSLKSSSAKKYNVPTRRGLTNENMLRLIRLIVSPLIEKDKPDVIVLQAGCDGLALDEHGEWNMTIQGYGAVIQTLLDKFSSVPFLILGGGGYNSIATAKCWAYLTKVVVGDISQWADIPDHKYLDHYESDAFQFWTPANTRCKAARKEENLEEYLEELEQYYTSYFNK